MRLYRKPMMAPRNSTRRPRTELPTGGIRFTVEYAETYRHRTVRLSNPARAVTIPTSVTAPRTRRREYRHGPKWSLGTVAEIGPMTQEPIGPLSTFGEAASRGGGAPAHAGVPPTLGFRRASVMELLVSKTIYRAPETYREHSAGHIFTAFRHPSQVYKH
jgi:hypothetical protein